MKRVLLVVVLAEALLALLAAPAVASAKTFYVPATPGGCDNTAAIQAAFDAAVKAGPGSTVQLGPGRFYTNTIFVQHFDGYFKGAGENATFIDTLRGLKKTLPPLTLTPDPSAPGTYVMPGPFLFGFRGGNIRISDMSFAPSAFSPAQSWLTEGYTFTSIFRIVLVTGNAGSALERVAFAPGAGDDFGLNIDGDLQISGKVSLNPDGFPVAVEPTGGFHTVSNCSFAGNDGIEAFGLTAGKLTIGGSEAQRNDFDVVFMGCLFTDDSNSDIVVTHNRMTSYLGNCLFLWQGQTASNGGSLPALPAPRHLVADNDMLASNFIYHRQVLAGAGGVLVLDESWLFGAPNRLWAEIDDNTISMDNGGYDGGIDGVGASGIRVLGNHISGTGVAGIDVGTDLLAAFGLPVGPTDGWQLIGNDVSGVNPVNAYGGPAAPIWLGTEASHCLVKGGTAPTQVLDQGTNDILINATKLPDPPTAATTPTDSLPQTKSLKEMERF